MKLTTKTLTGAVVTGAMVSLGSGIVGLMIARNDKKRLEEGVFSEKEHKTNKLVGNAMAVVGGLATAATLVAGAILITNDEVGVSEDDNNRYSYDGDFSEDNKEWEDAVNEYESDNEEDGSLQESIEEASNIAKELQEELGQG